MTFTSEAALIAASFSVFLGVFAYFKNPKGTANIYFALFNISLAVWNVGEISAEIHSHSFGLTLYRLSYIGASFLPLYSLIFLWSIANCRLPRVERVLQWIALAFALASPTNLIIKDIRVDLTQWTPIVEIHGVLYYPFICFYLFSLAFGLVPLFVAYRKSTGDMRIQLRYIMAALCIALLGSLNYLASQLSDRVPPLYCFVQMGLCATFGVAILKHRLMDIRVVVQKTFLYSVVTALAAAAYFAGLELLSRLFAGFGGPLAHGVLAAGIVALVFHPLVRKGQHALDRIFGRAALDPILLREATSGFAHEMKRPLTSIALPAELGLADIEDFRTGRTTAAAALEKIEARLRHIMRMSSEVAEKIEAIRSLAESKSELVSLDLRALVEDVVRDEQSTIDKERIEVDFQFPPTPLHVLGRPRQLKVALSNLVRNAVEAMAGSAPDRRKIIFRAAQTNHTVTLQIDDLGPGIAAELASRLFEPFFTTKGADGTGIGLYLSRQLLDSQSITMTYETIPVGARFVLVFHG